MNGRQWEQGNARNTESVKLLNTILPQYLLKQKKYSRIRWKTLFSAYYFCLTFKLNQFSISLKKWNGDTNKMAASACIEYRQSKFDRMIFSLPVQIKGFSFWHTFKAGSTRWPSGTHLSRPTREARFIVPRTFEDFAEHFTYLRLEILTDGATFNLNEEDSR